MPSESKDKLALLTQRSEALRRVREFFHDRGYLEVTTPAIVPSPGMDVHLDAFEVRTHRGERAGWLTTSPEYHMKRLLSIGAPRIYQMALAFRSGEASNVHLPQFTMVEWYRAESTADEMRAETEQLVLHFLQFHPEKCELPYQGRVISYLRPWESYSVAQAFERYAEMPMPDPANEEVFFRAFAEHLQPKLGWDAPVWLTHWPASMASLAQINSAGMADRFELFIAGMEICNGFLELTNATEQRKRFENDQTRRKLMAKTVYPIDEEFLTALEAGIPACSGNALGFDRLLMLVCDAPRIQDVVPLST